MDTPPLTSSTSFEARPSSLRRFVRYFVRFFNHTMKRFTQMAALMAVAGLPAIVAPGLMASAHAQDAAPAGGMAKEFQDVPVGHWAYPALQKLAAAGVLEGYPPIGDYRGKKPMTRYEFAVAIARILDRIPPANAAVAFDPSGLQSQIDALNKRPIPDITRAQTQDLIDALRREFADELARLDGRVTVIENRVDKLENRVAAPPRMTVAASFLHRRGFANYIDDSGSAAAIGANGNVTSIGRTFLRPEVSTGEGFTLANPIDGTNFVSQNGKGVSFDRRVVNRTFSYTDFEVRLSDRVSDRLSVNAALRSLGSTQEDPWVGNTDGGLYVREAFVSANLGNTRGLSFVKNLSATLGRQRTKIGLGLLYDNDLSPTDQLRYDANIGPVALTGFFGTQNNVGLGNGFGANGSDPYGSQGSNFYLDPAKDGTINDVARQRLIGFGTTGVAGGATQFTPIDDNETLGRASLNVFRIAGQPVSVGYSRLLDGYRRQAAESGDLTIPLFNRTIGFEAVRSLRTADGTSTNNLDGVGRTHRPVAGIVTANVLRTSYLDLNAAYGKADDNFEYLAASVANPYARSYGEAIFDRPVFLGAPLINGSGVAGEPGFLTAKEGYDVSGTLRIPVSFLRRLPLDFRYYTARSGRFVSGGVLTRRKLGEVYSIGTTLNLTPGLDLEVKGGFYNPSGNASTVRYVRIGANVGF